MKLEDPLAFFSLLNESRLERFIAEKRFNGYQGNLLREAMIQAHGSEPDMDKINAAFSMLQQFEATKKEREMREWADALIRAEQTQAQPAPQPWKKYEKFVRYGLLVLLLALLLKGLG